MSNPSEGAPLSDQDSGDAEKRQSLVKLREAYVQVREHGSPFEPHANLEWILGARRNPTQDPLGFETKTIEVVALWLQDLALDLDRRAPGPVSGDPTPDIVRSQEARRALAQRLRSATERFLAAFERQP